MAIFLPLDLDERDEPIKDGGVIASFQSDILQLQAQRYDSGGADSTLMLEEIRRVTTDASVTAFRAVVQLRGIWWSKDKRESSEHCMSVLSNLFNLGCVGLQDVLDLRHNDLDDTFVQECFGLIENHICSLDYINLNDNRITTEGALRLIRALEKRKNIDHRLPELLLHRNPIDDCSKVEQAAKDAGFQCEAGTALTLKNGKDALTHKELWSDYFAGPAQLLRTSILEQIKRMPLAECPICRCILTHDPRRTHSTMHNRLYSHLRGDRHRKNLRALNSDDDLPLILIVSPTVSFTLHPLTGEVRCFEKLSHALARPEPDADAYTVQLRPDATPSISKL